MSATNPDNPVADSRTPALSLPATRPAEPSNGPKATEEPAIADNPPLRETGRNIYYKEAVDKLNALVARYEPAVEVKRTGPKVGWVIVAAGFLFFGSSVVLLWSQWNKAVESVYSEKLQSNKANVNIAVANANTASVNAAATGVICGVLLELVALAIFYYHRKGFTDLQDQLDINERFLLATIICEGMDAEARQKAQTKLVDSLLGYSLKNQEQHDSKKAAEAGAVTNNFSVHQTPETSK